MEYRRSQDGHPFIRAVAQYIRQHEKALANSLQLHVQRRKSSGSQHATAPTTASSAGFLSQSSTTSTLAAALSFAGLSFRSHNVKSVQLTLTPHHLFYLLSRIAELDVDVGSMTVRIESILHSDTSASNYISFLQAPKAPKGRSDADSIHSVSSVRSVMSGMSALWSGMGAPSSWKPEKARLALENDIKYVYGAFTKLPALRLAPDHRTPHIKGYEQFPFDTAVPLFAFKNLQQLEIIDLDFRSFYGWDRLADQLGLLTIKRGHLDDPIDLLENIVLDDAEKRRRRSNRSYGNAPSTPSWSVPSTPHAEYARSHSDPGSPGQGSPGTSPEPRVQKDEYDIQATPVKSRDISKAGNEGTSPKRPISKRPGSSYRHVRTYSSKAKRSGSGSSNNSDAGNTLVRDEAAANASCNVLPVSKWQRLVYLSLADNGLSSLPERSLQSIAPSLRSFNLSSNLFTQIPDSLANLCKLVSLDLSNCMIDSLQSLSDHPLHMLTTLKLKSNRLTSLIGIENLPSLENLHVQDNQITDPDEAERLTRIRSFRKLWIKHNPLTRNFSDYRVRIMNRFRKVPHFTEDVVIDDQPASYSERKQLHDRAVQVQLDVPSLASAAGHQVILVQEPSKKTQPAVEASKKLSIVTGLQKQTSDASSRRKRASKRRIVDLAANEGNASFYETGLGENHTAADLGSAKLLVQSTLVADNRLLLPPNPPSPTVVADDEMARTLTNNSPTSEEYRRNVEEFRLKYGKNWLNALGEQTSQWQPDNELPTIASAHQQPQLHHYHSAPPVVDVGSRAL